MLDLTTLPVKLIISNKKEEVAELNAPKQLTLYPDNGILTLNPGEQVAYEVDNSRELLYYYNACEKAGLLIEVEEGEVAEDEGYTLLINLTGLPINLKITNPKADDAVKDVSRQLPLYGDNGIFVLNPGDELKYQVKTAREGMYYFAECHKAGLVLEIVD